MVCYWSISARLPYTFLLPFVLRLAAFVHADNVGWYTRDPGGRGGRATAVPRRNSAYPAYPAQIPETPGEKKNTLFPLCLFSFFSFFFLSRISPKVSAREKERRATVKYFVVTELDMKRDAFFFLMIELNPFHLTHIHMRHYIIFKYFQLLFLLFIVIHL